MSKLKDNCNKEVFIVYNDDENDRRIPVEIHIFPEFISLTSHLRTLVPSVDFGIKILHGILTRAFNLPKDLKGKAAFIIIDNDHLGSIVETNAQSDKDLVSIIEAMIFYNKTNSLASLKIENIYIFYGYEINTTLSLDEEEVDEETINVCEEIANNAVMVKLTCKQIGEEP